MGKKPIWCFVLVAWLAGTMTAMAQEAEIIAWNRVPEGHPAMYRILKEAFEQTVEDFGPYRLKLSIPMEQGRVVVELQKNKLVNVAVFAPDKERERLLLPIRIPVTKGLLSYRVCLIREQDADLFNNINSVEEWKERGLTIGAGTHWPNVPIFEASKVEVVTSPRYRPLFRMLAAGRFDCFDRSVNEVMTELEEYGDALNIVLEDNILIIYQLPTFFFVSKKAPGLAKRIETGLMRALEDGSFDEIFFEEYAEALELTNLPCRTPLRFENPFLTPKTRKALQNPKLWYDPFANEKCTRPDG